MQEYLENIISLLQDIKGNGTFVVSGTKNLMVPGLRIDGFGEVSFPLEVNQIESIINVSHKAPFGKGSKTIYDDSVRNVWEIDADSISFNNPEWFPFLNTIVNQAKKGLGFEKQNVVQTNLYKLLIYESGSFFLPHKDSEKEKGMFGTLVIGLPSKHIGGELKVSFDNRTQIVDFSEAYTTYKLPYTAFFADCEHEIKPVTSGYRICLVYNLVNTNSNLQIKSPKFSLQQNKISDILHSSKEEFKELPKAILLGHEYTPANFSLTNLKNHDKPRAEALLHAAEKAGYYAQLALVTYYQNGQLEADYDYYDSYRRYNHEPEGDGTMGEVYEEYTYVEHWNGNNPGLGNLSIEKKDVIADLNLGEGEPTEKEEEGFTGNAGMTIEYWYHYGAIVLWPKSKHISILKNRPVENKLEWLGYYIKKSHVPNSEYIHAIRELLLGFSEPNFDIGRRDTLDFSILATAICFIDDKIIVNKLNNNLSKIFDNINTESWCSLLKQYSFTLFKEVFVAVKNSNNLYKIEHLIHILRKMTEEKGEFSPALKKQIEYIPNYISADDIHNITDSYLHYKDNAIGRIEVAIRLIQDILQLSTFKSKDITWIEITTKKITKSLPRKYLNKVIIKALLNSKNKTPLFYSIKEVCLQELLHKTKEKPEPPINWTRKVPNSKHNSRVWEMLSPFLSSPIDSVYEYRANQQLRQEVENVIKSVTIDLKTQTITKGRPYTLKITKTQKEYEKLLKYWREDKMLLEQLKKTY
ncbi:hypothetical protein ABW636_19280 [Aquimarina sp. 2201CG1-2-11]|uniref:2OG-Fe(II) oxygenase n=1 Tax=Aquimarina discodermiae TaxID=3231043 RepID=UPI00346288A9